MKEEKGNIFTVFDELVGRKEKETLLNQRGCLIWMTGLSGSGKTTIAKAAERMLHDKGYLTQVLDGDNIRFGLNKNLGFSAEDRTENIRRIAEASKLFVDCGVVTLACFVSPEKSMRNQVHEILKDDYHLVYVKAAVADCEERDPKGLYKKARAGEIKHFTGIDAPYEEPGNPELIIDTTELTVEDSVKKLVAYIEPLVKHT